ncbi:acetoacetyl-CoA reductase [Salicola sp. Rm-C-2C1-2]|uniref:acetoacetyl-CoA reductase n=1 Tax=Salicola sp. Rm-C-2C1-2 TaxID=3141321 RepID=UPI0032E4D5CE
MPDSETTRVALVTGGYGGLGTAICKSFARDGYQVVSTYRSPERKEHALEWQRTMASDGLSIELVCMDVSDPESCQQGAKELLERYGRLDVLVNNAGITRDSVMKKMTVKQWHDVIHTNLDGVFNVTHPFLNQMLEQGFGRIVNISSVNGQKGQFGQVNYSAAKAGIHGFTKALAQEVARKGVTVNTVSPGYAATDMVMSVPEEAREKILSQVPIGRLAQPEEVARVVRFLADDESAFITGADYSVNGGMHMH